MYVTMSISQAMSLKRNEDVRPKNDSFRQKPSVEENTYFVHMPLTLQDKYDIASSTSRDQAFIQEFLYIYLIVKYTGKVPSVMYEEWKASLLTLKIAVEVSSQEENHDSSNETVDGMAHCKIYAAENKHPAHSNQDYFTPQVTSDGHVLFSLCTSLGNLSPNSKRTKLLFTGIHKQDENVVNIIDSFVNGKNMNVLLRNPVEFKVYVDIKLVNPLTVYCSFSKTTKDDLIKVMVTNNIQMPVVINQLQIFPNKTGIDSDGDQDCVIRQVTKMKLPKVIAPLEQFVFIYKYLPGDTWYTKFCSQIIWTAEPIKSRGQSIMTYYELPSHQPE